MAQVRIPSDRPPTPPGEMLPDLAADWQPIPGKAAPEGLISRGPDWPFAEVDVEEVEAA